MSLGLRQHSHVTAQPMPMPARLVLEYTLTADDLVDGSRAYYRHRPMFGWTAGTVIVIACLVTLWLTGNLLWLSGVALGLLALGAGQLRWLDRMILGASPYARIGMRCELEFTGSGVRFAQAGTSGLIEWSSITETREADKSIVLLQERAPLAMIPKRAFESTADLDAARALIAARVDHRPASEPKATWLVPLLIVVAVFVVAVFVVAVITAS